MLQPCSSHELAYDTETRRILLIKGKLHTGDYTVLGPMTQQVVLADADDHEVEISADGDLHVKTDDQAADEKVWDQITAATGSTDWHRVRDGVKNHVFQVKLAAVDTSVTVKCEGSQDGTNPFNLNAAVATTKWTTDATYLFTKTNCPCKFVRFTKTAEVGGTASLLDARWSGTE